MQKFIYFIFFFTLHLLNSCSNNLTKHQLSGIDTIVKKREIVVKYNLNTDTLNLPRILETSTMLIDDSLLMTNEFQILKHDKKRDSLNFINCLDYNKNLPIKYYDKNGQVLNCDIYFPTEDGWFFLGGLEFDSLNQLVLNQGKPKILLGYSHLPIYSRISFKIFIPKNVYLEKVLFKCE